MEITKKVLVLTTTYPTFLPGDATPPFVHELTKRLVTHGLEMLVLTPRGPGTKQVDTQDGVRIFRYPYFFLSKREKLADGAIMPNIKKNTWLLFQVPFLFFACLFSVIILCKKEKIRTIHAHRLFINGFVAALYKRYIDQQISFVCTAHGSDLHTLQGRLVDKLKKRTVHQADEVTVVSRYLKGQLDLLMGQETLARIISMGVDQDKFNSNKYASELKKKYGISGKFLLFVGRLSGEKGIADLIQVMPAVLKSFPDAKLLLIGDGPLGDEMKALVIQKNLSGSLHFLGALPNNELPSYYATADVFVLPSYKEGSPVVLLEALFSGTSCVGRRIPQLEEIAEKTTQVALFTTQEEFVVQLKRSLAPQKKITSDLHLASYSREFVSLAFYHICRGEK